MVMASRLTETLLNANSDMEPIHRRVVRVGAAAAWFVTAFFLISGFVTGDDAIYVEAIGPSLAAGLMTAQIVLRRENAGVALFGAAVVTMVMYGVVGNEDTLIPAAVAIVIIPAIGMLFVDTHRTMSVATAAILLVMTPFLWGLEISEALTLGAVTSITFVITSVIFLTVRSAAAALNVRYQTLFEHSPTAVMEEDWSEALSYVRSEYTGRPDRIKPFLMADPAVVKRAVARARVIRVNQAAMDLLEADGPGQVLGNRNPNSVTDETMEMFVGALVALYEGRKVFEQEAPALTFQKNSIWLQTKSTDTSTGVPASNILVGLADITHGRRRDLCAD